MNGIGIIRGVLCVSALLISRVMANEPVQEIRINAERGSYCVWDTMRNQEILKDARIGFVIAPYVDLEGLADDDLETQRKTMEFASSPGACRTEGNDTLVFRKDAVGELTVRIRQPSGQQHMEFYFAFRNLGDQPVRLREVTVADGQFMPDLDRSKMCFLPGNSASAKTFVSQSKSGKAENNALCFFPDPKDPRSLVAGGLTYADFRKGVKIADQQFSMYAFDPVGRRVDPGRIYESKDRFYLDGLTGNPFKALEIYAQVEEKARGIKLNYYTMPSVCMWFLSVDHFGGDKAAENSTVGAVREMQNIVKSGFLKYSPVAVRLVPDCYEKNNEQGWWDDEHWQLHGRDEKCIVDHHYKPPYETTEKWAQKIRELGGIPTTYFQPGVRSDDYAEALPGHMLYNKAWKYILEDGKIVTTPRHGRIFGKLYAESYDYTDPDFLKHWREVNQNLNRGGVQGVFYDYPDMAFPVRGGLEDRYATATQAYRTVYQVPREEMGPNAFLQERIGPGSDATLDFVSSVRTEGDNNTLKPDAVAKAAMRWYKNRRLTNYDMDGKSILTIGKKRETMSPRQRQAVLTMSYTVSGRLLLTDSFSRYSPEVLHDVSRVFPFHATPLSARPLDAFIRPSQCPRLYDFAINKDWHQLVLYNAEGPDGFSVSLSGDTAQGALGLDPGREYYVYDFWNDTCRGKLRGDAQLEQTLEPGEARMLAIHAVEDHPQFISTDRHLLQGYVELNDVVWDAEQKTLSGTASVIGGEPYTLIIALNGSMPASVAVDQGTASMASIDKTGLIRLCITAPENTQARWRLVCKQPLKNQDESK